jgi:hypothetical protein
MAALSTIQVPIIGGLAAAGAAVLAPAFPVTVVNMAQQQGAAPMNTDNDGDDGDDAEEEDEEEEEDGGSVGAGGAGVSGLGLTPGLPP